MDIARLYEKTEPYIIEMRRWFHAHPELSLQEKRTSQRIGEELDSMGIPHVTLSPGYGVAAVIEGTGKRTVHGDNKAGVGTEALGEGKRRSIAVRADMDALPVREETGLPFTSRSEGVMHACGHDAHVAMLLGAARVLSRIKDELCGTVYLIFQAAEEVGKGAEEAIAYLEKSGGVDQVIGLHIWSTIAEGEILLIPGPVFAGGTGFTCKITGQGGHGARPDLVKDPIKAACDLVMRLSEIPSNYYDVFDHSVVSVGMIQSGTMGNIFPSEALLKGTTRYFKAEGRERLEAIMNRIAEGVGRIHEVEVRLNQDGGVIPVMNDGEMIARARLLAPQVQGLTVSEQTEPICAGDNFGFILDRYRGFYGVLGGGKKGAAVYPQHHCSFDVEESALRKGSEFMTRFVCDYLGGSS